MDPDAAKRGGTLKNWKTEEDAGLDPGVFHVNNTEVIISTMTQPYTYQPTKNLIAMDGMVGFEQVDPTTFVWSVRPGMKSRTTIHWAPRPSPSASAAWRSSTARSTARTPPAPATPSSTPSMRRTS